MTVPPYDLYCLEHCDSTNDEAKARVRTAPRDLVVVTSDQRQGRGTHDRTWHLTPGRALAISVGLVHPNPDHHATLTQHVAGAVAAVLQRYGLIVTIKPPNDLMVGSSKIAGILCESTFAGDTLDTTVIGVGLNVLDRPEDFPPHLQDTATSMWIAKPQAYDLPTLTRELSEALLAVAHRPSDYPKENTYELIRTH